MNHYLLIALYVLSCLLVAYYGRGTRLGFWGLLLLCMFLSPLLIFGGLLLLAPFQADILAPFKSKRLD